MKIKRRARRKPIVPINAMSDIAFLLLVFIMVISLINYRKEIKIDYPEAQLQEKVSTDIDLELWINLRGEIFHAGELISEREAENIIVAAITKDPTVRIHVLADKKTRYKDVAKLIQILQLLQHRVVSLVVESKKET